MRQSKLPTKFPNFVCKATWDSTALYLVVAAKNELDAWDRAWKKVSKMDGGDLCRSVDVIRMKE